MTYAVRAIDLRLQLNDGSTFDGTDNAVTITGLRISATISKAGAVGMSNASIRAFGVDPHTANSVSTLGKLITAGRNNTVTLSAGNVGGTMSTAFIGTIQQAWQDFQGAPDVALTITAFTGLLDQLKPIPPTSYKGPTDVATIIAGLAKQMGYSFENGGVAGVLLANPYLSGTGREQAYAAAEAAGINITMDDQPNGVPTLAIWPKNGVRSGSNPLISSTTGMVGYPTWTQNGIIVKTEFNPQIVFGANVQVQSIVPQASGTWSVFSVTHELESAMPGGKWFTTLSAATPGHMVLPS